MKHIILYYLELLNPLPLRVFHPSACARILRGDRGIPVYLSAIAFNSCKAMRRASRFAFFFARASAFFLAFADGAPLALALALALALGRAPARRGTSPKSGEGAWRLRLRQNGYGKTVSQH